MIYFYTNRLYCNTTATKDFLLNKKQIILGEGLYFRSSCLRDIVKAFGYSAMTRDS